MGRPKKNEVKKQEKLEESEEELEHSPHSDDGGNDDDDSDYIKELEEKVELKNQVIESLKQEIKTLQSYKKDSEQLNSGNDVPSDVLNQIKEILERLYTKSNNIPFRKQVKNILSYL